MIHARHQFQPYRHLTLVGFDSWGRPNWRPKPVKHAPNGGNHANPMPPSLAARQPALFDGTWLTEVQRARLRARARRYVERRESSLAAEEVARRASFAASFKPKWLP